MVLITVSVRVQKVIDFPRRSALQITWKRKTGEMASNAYSFDYGRRLRLVAVTPSDAGLYQCIASDGIADTQAAVSLDVDGEYSRVFSRVYF